MTDADLRSTLADRLAAVDARIAAACRRAGRERSAVTLVAVTKTVSPHVAALPPAHLAYQGRWRIDDSHATAEGRGARIHLNFSASRVFLVLGARGGPHMVRVELDGRPHGTVTVRGNRLYELVRLPRPGEHRLALTLAPGTEAYAFTFG